MGISLNWMSGHEYCQGVPQFDTGQFIPVFWSTHTMITCANTASTKDGIAYINNTKVWLVVSIQLLALSAEIIPKGTPMMTCRNNAQSPNSNEIGTPSLSISKTARALYTYERPKLNVNRFFM